MGEEVVGPGAGVGVFSFNFYCFLENGVVIGFGFWVRILALQLRNRTGECARVCALEVMGLV